MFKRVVPGVSLLVVAALLLTLTGDPSRLSGQQISLHHKGWSENLKTILFSGPDQNGVITGLQVGTTEPETAGHRVATVKGAVLVNFRYFLTGPTTFNFDIRTGITDTDGDQLIYRATGSGRFVCPPLADVTSPPLPGPPQGIFGLGGPLSGTAVVTSATASSGGCPTCGKYVSLLGVPLAFRGVEYNPGNGCDPAQQFGLGVAFNQVFGPNIHHP